MYNARSHIANMFRLFGDNLNILFNVPYSPFLNPIEELFGLWKHHFRKLNFSNDKDIIFNIKETAKKLQCTYIIKFYQHSLKYVIISLKEELIE